MINVTGNKLTKLFSLGELYVSDFVTEQKDLTSSNLTLYLDKVSGLVQLGESVDYDKLYRKYWYSSGTNETMRKELEQVVKDVCYVTAPEGAWLDIGCFVAGNFINTDKGHEDIVNIREGDKVLCHDGEYHKVTKLFSKKEIGCFVDLKLRGHNSNILMTGNHPILTKRGWIPAQDLNDNDLVSLRSGFSASNQSEIDLYPLLKDIHANISVSNNRISPNTNGLKTSIPQKLQINKDLVKIIGYYIGEGSGAGGTGIDFTFHSQETQKIKDVQDYFSTVFGINTETRVDTNRNGNTTSVRLHSRLVSKLFKLWCGDCSQNKKIPNLIFNTDLISHFIKALWFTDGHTTTHKNKIKYVYSTTSKQLAVELRNILESFNCVCSLQCVANNRGFSKKDGTIYRITVERNDSVKIFERVLSGEKLENNSTERFVKILKCDKSQQAHHVYNFEVEDSHSYTCNGITVHNCNDGTLLGFVPKSMERVGCDPSDVAADAMGDYSLVNDYFTKENVEKYGKFKVITAIAMFYDLIDPVRFLRDIYDVLEDDGVFVVQMSYLPLMLKQLAFDNIVAEHLCYYSLQSLMYFLNRANLRVVDCKLNDVNGGSFVVHIQKTCATVESYATAPYRDVANWRIEATLEMEHCQKMYSLATYRRFFAEVELLKKRTVDFIKRAVKEGKTVYGLGASTKGNTLLQYYGLDNTLITAISERQPKKHGLRTVGTDIPICSEKELRDAKPDYVLVLPWHFIHELKNREKEYLSNGGKFIVPCPKFEVIDAG